MKVTTREIQQNTRAVRERLEAGQTLEWTLRGRVIASLHPVTSRSGEVNWPDPLARLRSLYGDATHSDGPSASELIYEDRG